MICEGCKDAHEAADCIDTKAGRTYNFPLPAMPADQRHAIEAAGQAILDARAERPEMSLEDHYSPTRMTEAVREAHTRLDRLVDQVFGITELDPTFLRRQEVLFAHYEELSAHLLTTAATPARKRSPRTQRGK